MASTPQPAGESLAILIPQGSIGASGEIPIFAPVAGIGQAAQNEIRLDDDTVSSRHARLEYDSGSWRVTDLESRNGTYVAGNRVEPGVPTLVEDGAIIGIGAVKLQLSVREGANLERARAEYTPPLATPRLAERSGVRLPVWLVLVVLIVVVAIIALIMSLGGDPQVVAPAAPAALLTEILGTEWSVA